MVMCSYKQKKERKLLVARKHFRTKFWSYILHASQRRRKSCQTRRRYWTTEMWMILYENACSLLGWEAVYSEWSTRLHGVTPWEKVIFGIFVSLQTISSSGLSPFDATHYTDTQTAVKFITSRDGSSVITTTLSRLTYSIIHETKFASIFHMLA
jgi:hypothetical protein